MIDFELFKIVNDSFTKTLADCAIRHQHMHYFFTLYLLEKEDKIIIVERTKPSMRQINVDEFKQLTHDFMYDKKVIEFLNTYDNINQKFELEKMIGENNRKNNLKI